MGEAGPSSSGRIAYLGPEGTYGQQVFWFFLSSPLLRWRVGRGKLKVESGWED